MSEAEKQKLEDTDVVMIVSTNYKVAQSDSDAPPSTIQVVQEFVPSVPEDSTINASVFN